MPKELIRAYISAIIGGGHGCVTFPAAAGLPPLKTTDGRALRCVTTSDPLPPRR